MSKVSITYGVTVCNELEELKRLLKFLNENKKEQDEILVLLDKEGKTEEVESFLKDQKVSLIQYPLNGNFAEFKNKLTEHATKDYLFAIDADEIPSDTLLQNLHTVLEMNPERSIFAIPRINTVDGLTQEHVRKWGWPISKMPNQIGEKIMDTDSDEYKLLKQYSLIIEEYEI